MPGLHVYLLTAALMLVAGATSPIGANVDQVLLVPSDEAPWPMWAHDAGRTRNAGAAATPAAPASFGDRWQVAEEGAAGRTYSMVAEVAPDAGLEVVTARGGDFAGQGGLEVRTKDGALLWLTEDDGASAGPPLVADFDGDGAYDIFASRGKTHELRAGNGELIWQTEFRQRTGNTVSYPLAVDVTGDGILDVVQSGNYYEEDAEGLPLPGFRDETVIVWGFDGPTGELLFEHALPCGLWSTQLVGVMLDGEPLVIAGCNHAAAQEIGIPGATIEALHIVPTGTIVRAVSGLLHKLDLELPYEAEVVWSHEVRNGEATLRQVALADVHEGDGPEVVVLWTDDEQVNDIGLTALGLDGKFLFEHVVPMDGGVNPGTLTVADLDADGRDEVGFVQRLRAAFWSFTGDGLDELWRVPGPGEDGLGNPVGMSVADFDADGSPEVVIGYQRVEAGQPSSVRIYSSAGSLLWARDYPQGDGVPVTPIRGATIADLDGDGTFEIIYPALRRLLVFGV